MRVWTEDWVAEVVLQLAVVMKLERTRPSMAADERRGGGRLVSERGLLALVFFGPQQSRGGNLKTLFPPSLALDS